MKGHRLQVRRKMKENNGKMKKFEASLIKRLMRINWYIFHIILSVQFWSSHSILSLILFDTLSFLRALLEECGIIWIWLKKAKEKQESARGQRDR